MLYPVLISFIGGVFSRRWSGFLTLLAGIVLVWGCFRLIPTLSMAPNVGPQALGVVVGGLAVEITIIVIIGLAPFLLRGLWRYMRSERE